ncbi:MAG: hypothetical protein V4587_19360 [Acidobacteriota bacterium]
MAGIQSKTVREATAQSRGASVQDMSEKPATIRALHCDRASVHFQVPWLLRGLIVAIFPLLLQVLILTPKASAGGLQSEAAAPSNPSLSESLSPALDQVGHSVGQIQIDHWKVSKNWKEQLQSDANSISNDLSHQLPGLLQQAQSTPAALDAQLRLMQNVNALYDVLVRLTLAADLTEKKSDAALLNSALERLEAAKKKATTSLIATAAQQHQQLTDLTARVEAIQASGNVSAPHGKTIVVDNDARHTPVHHTHHKKPSPSTHSKSQSPPAPSPGAKSQP